MLCVCLLFARGYKAKTGSNLSETLLLVKNELARCRLFHVGVFKHLSRLTICVVQYFKLVFAVTFV